MTKQQFVPQTDENRYLNTTHKCNLTGSQISTILYYLDTAFSNISEDIIPTDINTIYQELQSVTDNYYAQLEEETNINGGQS